jgi:hypothetical protein
MAAFALGDEQSPRGHLQVCQPQPEDFAAAQSAQHHRLGHRPVPVGAQRRQQCIDLRWFEDARQRPWGAYQRHALAWPLPFPPGR